MKPYLPFFGIFIIFIAWTTYKLRESKSIQNKQSEEFWNRENDSNNVRRKPVDHLDYIRISSSCIPSLHIDNTEINSIIDQILSMSELSILNLTGLTNTDLKYEYGPANLTFLSECDENFTRLCRLLNSLGSCLHNNGYDAEAIMVYEYAISIGSDVSACYDALASLYIQMNTPDKINDLISRASMLNSLLKDSIINKLNLLIESVHN